MPQIALSVIYLLGLLIAEGLRLPRRLVRMRHRETWHRAADKPRFKEMLVMTAVLVGIWILPLGFIFFRWFGPLDYALPAWASLLGMAFFALGLVVRWAAQCTLDRWWSPTVELAEGHRLITTGIYSRIRHPIYTSLFLWACAQPLLLHNWLAGWGGMVACAMVCFVRVPDEERMLRDRFGDEYISYASRTGKFIPRLWK